MHREPNSGWRKSTRSGGDDNCVEVNISADWVGIRDSKAEPEGPVLTGTREAFRKLVDGLRHGMFS